jgi:hypothetical protein
MFFSVPAALADSGPPQDGAGLGGAHFGIAASCLNWLLAPDLEAQEILEGSGPQGHSLAWQRGSGWETWASSNKHQ